MTEKFPKGAMSPLKMVRDLQIKEAGSHWQPEKPPIHLLSTTLWLLRPLCVRKPHDPLPAVERLSEAPS